MKAQWIITVDGYPVVGTNAYSRKDAISRWLEEREESWKSFREAGYEAVKVELKQAV